MSYETFKVTRFNQESLIRIEQCKKIISRYLGQGLRLTLRQLYYQLVTSNVIINEEKQYKKLSSLVSNARLSGLIDWNAIEDRIRQPHRVSEFSDLGDLIETAVSSYRLPRWRGQDYYAELWVEKDALAGVLKPLAREFHVTMMVNRGYSSQSAMYDSANRFRNYEEKQLILAYIGDHDPSGEDMVRDIQDRLNMFEVNVEVKKIALTIDQVQEHNLPPNPAKMDDPRYQKYEMEHGNESWEVDALPPEVLVQLIQDFFHGIIDSEKMQEVIDKEERDIERLRGLVKEEI